MILAQRTSMGRALAPAITPRLLAPARTTRPVVLRRYKEGEQADTSQQGSKAPKNPITGERLQPVSDPRKEGYQATEQIPQSEATTARINQQLEAQPGGRDFSGECMIFSSAAWAAACPAWVAPASTILCARQYNSATQKLRGFHITHSHSHSMEVPTNL